MAKSAFQRSLLSGALLLQTLAFATPSTGNAQTTPGTSVAAEDPKKAGSLYLQCDGNPNNMTAGESIARLVALSAVIGLLAPPPESPDASKRKFGKDGVEACNGILTGHKAEGNAIRRIPLILARALHNIEAQDYASAVTDVHAARAEARAAGLTGNPYFDRSTGLSFNLIESQALLRMGKIAEAREVNVADADKAPFSLYPMLTVRDIADIISSPLTAKEEENLRNLSKISTSATVNLTMALDNGGRFKDSAEAWRAVQDGNNILFGDEEDFGTLFTGTQIAIGYAMADDWTNAEFFNAQNQRILSQLRASGKSITDEPSVVERMDFYSIIKMAHDGATTDARRMLASRSRWTAPTFGQSVEMNRRLRQGAKSDELFGFLADTPESLIERRKEESLARLLETDKNNKTLFSYILPYASVSGYERMSRRTWNTRGNKIIAKDKIDKGDAYIVSLLDGESMTQPEILLLHSALQAKARGHSYFIFRMAHTQPRIAFTHFAPQTQTSDAQSIYFDAEQVIADLRKVIPSPDDIKQRTAVKQK